MLSFLQTKYLSLILKTRNEPPSLMIQSKRNRPKKKSLQIHRGQKDSENHMDTFFLPNEARRTAKEKDQFTCVNNFVRIQSFLVSSAVISLLLKKNIHGITKKLYCCPLSQHGRKEVQLPEMVARVNLLITYPRIFFTTHTSNIVLLL